MLYRHEEFDLAFVFIIAASSRLWPGIRMQAIDMVQPPGMSLPPDMELQK